MSLESGKRTVATRRKSQTAPRIGGDRVFSRAFPFCVLAAAIFLCRFLSVFPTKEVLACETVEKVGSKLGRRTRHTFGIVVASGKW